MKAKFTNVYIIYIILFFFLYIFTLDPGIRGTGPVTSRPPLLEPGFQCLHSICYVMSYTNLPGYRKTIPGV